MWLNISIFALKLLPLCMHSSKWFQHDLNYDNKDKKHSGQLLHKYAYYLYRDCIIDYGKDLTLEKYIHTGLVLIKSFRVSSAFIGGACLFTLHFLQLDSRNCKVNKQALLKYNDCCHSFIHWLHIFCFNRGHVDIGRDLGHAYTNTTRKYFL